MKRKILAVFMSLMLLLSAGLAQAAAPEIPGTWYVTQLVSGGAAYNLADLSISMIVELNDDGSGLIRVSDGESAEESPAAWIEKEEDAYSFMESATQVEVPLRAEEDYLVLGDENDYYILRREPGTPVTFAETVAAADAADFNGEYAAEYMSGSGFTIAVSSAMDEMSLLGAADTGIVIQDGKVRFFGAEEAEFTFDPETGTLYLDASAEEENIRIFRLADGGIAANWYGMTFYAVPVE